MLSIICGSNIKTIGSGFALMNNTALASRAQPSKVTDEFHINVYTQSANVKLQLPPVQMRLTRERTAEKNASLLLSLVLRPCLGFTTPFMYFKPVGIDRLTVLFFSLSFSTRQHQMLTIKMLNGCGVLSQPMPVRCHINSCAFTLSHATNRDCFACFKLFVCMCVRWEHNVD